ncbi:MAG: YeeE/YedE family protein [Pseudomonadota bacterium]
MSTKCSAPTTTAKVEMELADGAIAALIGLGGGLLLGLAGQMGRFCTLGAIEDALYGQDYDRLRMWSLAIGLSIAGAFILLELGYFAVEDTIYAARAWDPAASVIGGLIFGYGMAIAGNCGFGALTRLGGGDLRSFLIVIVMGISAYMTIGGPIGLLRVELFGPETFSGDLADFGFAHAASAATGVSNLMAALLIAAVFILLALSGAQFRRSPTHILWSVVVAIAIISAWAGLGGLSANSFDNIQVESHTFTAPVGETMLYLMTATGGGVSFSIGSVAGVLVGAAIGAQLRGRFRWEACDDPQELGRQIFGGFLMGVGAVLAVGCSVGQGLTAMSTLSFSAPVVLASIFVGANIGLRQLIHGWRAPG